MTEKDVDTFEKIYQQLLGFFNEISLLSKKRPDDGINKFKLHFINLPLIGANELLGKSKPFDDFSSFDEDNIPTNSDAVVIMSQYLKCFEKYRWDNVEQYGSTWYWRVNGKRSEKKAVMHKQLI